RLRRLVPIPPVVSTFNICPIINVEYFLYIELTTIGILSTTTASAQLPLIIGTIPLRQVCTPPSRQVSAP
ncbi:hypothetical protein PMAYCL1PPCAC_24820, partial [Pristionchus mayeri]